MSELKIFSFSYDNLIENNTICIFIIQLYKIIVNIKGEINSLPNKRNPKKKRIFSDFTKNQSQKQTVSDSFRNRFDYYL